MKTYPEELKASIIQKLLPPHNAYVPQLSKETGIPKDTLYAWRIKHRRRGQRIESMIADAGGGISSAEKFDIVLETAPMNEAQLGAYCREKGFYPGQIQAWRTQCRDANQSATARETRKKVSEQARQIRKLESELRRKEKALAEAAALLVLKKKARQIWGDPEDD
jgi:transposase-like protein